MPPEEIVLTLTQQAVDRAGRFQGISREFKRFVEAIELSDSTMHVRRIDAEQRDDIKQIITYVLIRIDSGTMLTFRRGSYSQASTFLKGRLCVGFGGHVEATDRNLFSFDDSGLRAGSLRELTEELNATEEDFTELELVAALNDDSSTLGNRHFAFIYETSLRGGPADANQLRGEPTISSIEYLRKEQIGRRFHELEYWSQLCAIHLLGIEPQDARVVMRTRRAEQAIADGVVTVVVTGEIGVGKSAVSRVLEELLALPVISTRESISRALGTQISPTEVDRPAFAQAAYELVRTTEGLREYVGNLAQEISRQGGRGILDGVRNEATVAGLRKADSRLLHVHVHAMPNQAYARYRDRVRRDVPIHEFRSLREHVSEREIELLASKADVAVFNYGDEASLREALEENMA